MCHFHHPLNNSNNQKVLILISIWTSDRKSIKIISWDERNFLCSKNYKQMQIHCANTETNIWMHGDLRYGKLYNVRTYICKYVCLCMPSNWIFTMNWINQTKRRKKWDEAKERSGMITHVCVRDSANMHRFIFTLTCQMFCAHSFNWIFLLGSVCRAYVYMNVQIIFRFIQTIFSVISRHFSVGFLANIWIRYRVHTTYSFAFI